MAFDWSVGEIDRIVVYENERYRVIDQTRSGLLLVSKEEDIKSGKYPLETFVIPEHN